MPIGAEAIARHYVDCVNKADLEGLTDVFTEDARIWIAGTVYTKASFRALAYAVVNDVYEKGPFMKPTNCLAVGDRAMIEVDVSGLSKTGKNYSNRYCIVFNTKDGKAISMNEYLDTAVARITHGRLPPDE